MSNPCETDLHINAEKSTLNIQTGSTLYHTSVSKTDLIYIMLICATCCYHYKQLHTWWYVFSLTYSKCITSQKITSQKEQCDF